LNGNVTRVKAEIFVNIMFLAQIQCPIFPLKTPLEELTAHQFKHAQVYTFGVRIKKKKEV
jgi:hypothetical protein